MRIHEIDECVEIAVLLRELVRLLELAPFSEGIEHAWACGQVSVEKGLVGAINGAVECVEYDLSENCAT